MSELAINVNQSPTEIASIAWTGMLAPVHSGEHARQDVLFLRVRTLSIICYQFAQENEQVLLMAVRLLAAIAQSDWLPLLQDASSTQTELISTSSPSSEVHSFAMAEAERRRTADIIRGKAKNAFIVFPYGIGGSNQ